MKLESKVGKVPEKDEQIFRFLSDFNNFKHLVPSDKVRNWQSDTDSCRFTVDMVGEIGFRIIEKEPYKLIKMSNHEITKHQFKFWIQLKEIAESDTAVKLTMELELNPVLQMMVKTPLQKFLDSLVDQLAKINFQENPKG
jgi:carbon monoxide dehydrogenase subunit G